ncbi:neuronal acetylcholine receptor subunit alpha-9-like isoform X2 [Lineus longissimus]|uniref:neuronal acetylcholine receptor subunit alpha-9-like isoform X2 n=1 Tax=Lineus longissimus TaxID=88925 RepID=UPI00315D817F
MGKLDGLLYILACCLALTAASKDERRLLQSLLKDTDTAARPVLNAWEVVNVTLRMWILHVLRLEQAGENLTMATKYRLRWNAPVMTWKPEDHGNVTALHVQPTRIWTPDLILQNNLMKEKLKNGEPHDSLLADTPVVVTYDGKAEWRLPTITKAHCKIDAMYFPFDRQRCTMNFTLLSHTVNEVRLLPESPNALTLDDVDNHKSSVWQVAAEPVKQGLVLLGMASDPHSQLSMTLILERKPLFFIFNLIYPAVVIMAVSILSLLLPNKSGEKMVFSVSILVAMNFFQQNLLKISFPTEEGIPLLEIYSKKPEKRHFQRRQSHTLSDFYSAN